MKREITATQVFQVREKKNPKTVKVLTKRIRKPSGQCEILLWEKGVVTDKELGQTSDAGRGSCLLVTSLILCYITYNINDNMFLPISRTACLCNLSFCHLPL